MQICRETIYKKNTIQANIYMREGLNSVSSSLVVFDIERRRSAWGGGE